MATTRLTPADYRQMPWRNGAGTTTEIAVAPEGAGLSGARFSYRVSIAEVTKNGPFSRFEGYDRHIMLLAGGGMSLECGVHGSLALHAPFEPRAFSGDWDVHGALVAGPVRDFNLIVDRAWASSTLDARLLDRPEVLAVDAATTCIVHVIEGELVQAGTGDTLVTCDAQLELVPRGLVRLAVARITQHQR